MKRVFVTLLLLLTPCIVLAQQGDLEVSKIKNNIYLLKSPAGGNVIVSVGGDGAFLIDDQLTGRSEVIKNAVKNISGGDAKFILNTHYHFDHAGGNEFFGNSGAIIVAHDNVRKRLSSKQFITYFKKELPPTAKAGLPVVTFSKDVTFHYNDDEIHIMYAPAAHTDGDAVSYFSNENVIVAGDVIFNGMYPFIDTEHGGSIKGVIAALDMLLNIADDRTIIAPGHGDLMNKTQLYDYRKTLATISERVEAAIKSGKSLEETVAQKPSKEFDANMKEGIVSPDAFVSIIYQNLSY